MANERLDRIEQLQESNARSIEALTDSQKENAKQIIEVGRTINEVGRQINQLRSDLLEVASDFHAYAAANNQVIYDNNKKIAENNNNIAAILQYLQAQTEAKKNNLDETNNNP